MKKLAINIEKISPSFKLISKHFRLCLELMVTYGKWEEARKGTKII